MNCFVEFEKMPWVEVNAGLRMKTFKKGEKIIKLIELSDGFVEADWCELPHTNYILEGEYYLQFEDSKELVRKGDVLYIPSEYKHKAVIPAGQKVVLLAF